MALTPPRILIISPNWIGDAVMAQPLLQKLKTSHPDSLIDVLTSRTVAPVWRAIAEVEQIIETPFQHGKLQLTERWKLAKLLRKCGYAEAYILPNTLKYALIPWFAGIPRRVGYRGETRYGIVNIMHRDEKFAPRPMVPFYSALADKPSRIVSPATAGLRPALHVSDQIRTEALKKYRVDQRGPLIIFAPGAEFGSAKRWPGTYFARLADLIIESERFAQIILLGSPGDREVCEEITTAAGAIALINLAGKTTLDEAIALIAASDAVVSNDSGLLHIASGFNRPVVAVYGPTDPNHAPPFSDISHALFLGLSCAPCRQRECPLGHHACMRDMPPEMVWQPVHQILQTI
jgi:heptosyltransferase-2